MATSIASQLQAIRSVIQTDSDPRKRPITRPSILFNPKQAADIDIETILNIALSGLDVLVTIDERFTNYKNDLFSPKSKDLDRELMREDENNQINATIASYLRLLSGHLQLPVSLKTLEYLIRRYKIHVYNVEDLILCALPYHETHSFVRIVQLLGKKNNRWKFLEGVKVSGAPPPRNLLVQQCIRDMGVLDAISNYATPIKKYHPSRPVVSFCTAVIIEVLGSLSAVSDDIVKRILPFVVSGLQPGGRQNSEHKAGVLMIIGLLASKAALSPKLLNSSMRSIAEIAREDSKIFSDHQWFRLSIMALINLVQSQSITMLPKKVLEILEDTRDVPGILLELYKEFNIDKFLFVLLESLVDYSLSLDACHRLLLSAIETVPLKNFVNHLVTKILSSCLKMSRRNVDSTSLELGGLVKKILMLIKNKYPSDLRHAVKKFLENTRVQTNKGESELGILCAVLDADIESSVSAMDTKVWFSLHHPKAEVRRAAVVSLSNLDIMSSWNSDSEGLITIQDALLLLLRDDNLTVVQAALSIKGLTELPKSSNLFDEIIIALNRCLHILKLSSSDITATAADVAASLLKIAVSSFKDETDYLEKLAALIFPLLLILPKTWRLNLAVLELAKEVKWPLYATLGNISIEEVKLEQEIVSLVNLEIVNSLSDAFLMNHTEYISWFIRSCNGCNLSKTLLFLIMMQSIPKVKTDSKQFSVLFEAFFSYVKTDLEACEASFNVLVKEHNVELRQWDCKQFLFQLFDNFNDGMNANILICLFWNLMEAFQDAAASDVFAGGYERWVGSKLQDLFVFFTTSKMSRVFKEHVRYMVTKCSISAADFLSHFFLSEDFPVAVQVESLHCFALICSDPDDRLLLQLLTNFPSLFVPLASENQDVRTAAMDCIERLCSLIRCDNFLSKKNGSSATWIQFLDGLLDIIIQQRLLILSDEKLLPSVLTSLLGSSSTGLLVPEHVEQRLDESTKESVLAYIWSYTFQLNAFAKLRIISMLKGLGHKIMRIKDVEMFLSQLLKRRSQYYFEGNKSHELSGIEVQILCLLLETCALSALSLNGHGYEDHLMTALRLNGLSSEESAVVEPCITVLRFLSQEVYSSLTSEKQVLLFRELVFLYQNANGNIHNSTREAILRLNITYSVVGQTLHDIRTQDIKLTSSVSPRKKKKSKGKQSYGNGSLIEEQKSLLSFTSSLLDILVMKKDILSREYLIGPLFKLLTSTGSGDLLETLSSTVCFVQQTVMSVIEDIIGSLNVPAVDSVADQMNIKMLITFSNSTEDLVTRNHVFSLLTAIAKMFPEKIVDHILDIITIVGESSVNQIDSHSQCIFEDLLSAVVPCWLAKTKDIEKLLLIFLDVVPKVSEHRRVSIFVPLLRILGERDSLASLLLLLFRSLISRNKPSCVDDKENLDSLVPSLRREWEFFFALQICEQYSSRIWLQSLVMLLQIIGSGQSCPDKFMETLIAVDFTIHQLHDPEFTFKLAANEDLDDIQGILQKIMEHVVSFSNLVDAKRVSSIPVKLRKQLRESVRSLLRIMTTIMTPSAYFGGLIGLLALSDGNVQKKALSLLCARLRDHNSISSKSKSSNSNSSSYLLVDEKSQESFEKMCASIIQLVNVIVDEDETSVKLSAITTLEVLACKYPSHGSVFNSCLPSIRKGIISSNMTLASSCLRTTGAVINMLGPRVLAEVPMIMENVMKKSHEVLSCINDNSNAASSQEPLMLSILVSLEAIIDKLGGFLSPYLEDILKLIVVVPQYMLGSNLKLSQKAEVIRKLLIEKMPARLIIPSLLKIYPDAVDSGDSSVVTTFEVLGSIIGRMDRSTVGVYYGKIFDLCLHALDLRRERPNSILNILIVEKSTINALVSLTMKLTETMFKPLFIRCIEWAEPYAEGNAAEGVASVDRTISFYGLVNQLAESHRSLFVPYFKHLLENSVRHLTDTTERNSVGLIRKNKKAKLQEAGSDKKRGTGALALKSWHLRALVMSALHKCFLYDTGNLKFLDSANFQVLLKPIVSQLIVEPPAMLDENPDIPSLKEVDDLVVVCIGQMAVTAGSDLLWKPLNHEVLLQTRSDRVRPRVLGLRIVKHLLDNLKEEYLVFLPETIPFLGELLEDVELSVKSLAQDILKEMESMSGESLRQYLL